MHLLKNEYKQVSVIFVTLLIADTQNRGFVMILISSLRNKSCNRYPPQMHSFPCNEGKNILEKVREEAYARESTENFDGKPKE